MHDPTIPTRLAVIDLGTNTFHIIIAEVGENGELKQLFKHRIFVKLAEKGIGKIGPKAYQRALEATDCMQAKLKEYQVSKVRAFGTAALRTASNGQQFIEEVRQRNGIEIQLISGAEEARLIHIGVKKAIPSLREKALIMDIGGGSVEFILIEEDQVLWAKSFPIGVAVLFKRFHRSDPISDAEIEQTISFLDQQLEELKILLQQHSVKIMVGASGTFDVLENALSERAPNALSSSIPVSQYPAFYRQLIKTTKAERYAMKDIPDTRADMIVVAIILIDFVLQLTDIQTITISSYALKEGMLQELSIG